MTQAEFSAGIIYLAAGIGKEPPDGFERPYFDLLGKLSEADFLQACRLVMASHKWATFPTVAELLEAARRVSAKDSLTAAEAFAIATRAAAQIDPRITGPYRVKINGDWQEFDSQADYVFARLKVPERVQKAIRVFGIEALCNTDEPIAVMRAHFQKMFDGLEDRDRREALLPPEVRKILERKPTPKAAIETRRDADVIQQAMATIGGMPG